MRTLYFLRHGDPALPPNVSVCLGRMDVPLSAFGRLRAAVAAHALAKLPIAAVFCSPLLRARQTADLLHCPYQILGGLQEIDTGEWDGLTFDDIRLEWPELYEKRGKNPFLPFPKAEPPGLSLLRFLRAIGDAARQAEGDLLFVSHAGILRLFFAVLKGLPPLGHLPALTRKDAEELLLSADTEAIRKHPGYGSLSVATEKGGILSPCSWGRIPRPLPDRAFCLSLLEAANVPPHILRHCKAVARKAEEMADALALAGHPLQKEQILAASLLHDIARTQKNHAEKGADALKRLGYPGIAALIRTHHDLPCDTAVDEAAIVFLADKLVQEDQAASIRQRFEISFKKCVSKMQKERHQERYHAARCLAKKVNRICGREIAKME